MDTVTFRIGQRRTLWTWVGIGIASAALAVSAFLNHWGGGFAYALAAFGVVVPPMVFDRLFARTDLTTDGLITRSLIRRRSCRWDEVVRIGEKKSSSGGSTSTEIIIYRRTGRPIKLYAPFTSTAPGGDDPLFGAAVAAITAHWERWSGVAGSVH